MPTSNYRSRFEEKVALDLKGSGVVFSYEEKSIKFVQPQKNRRYTPDFFLPNGVILEVKGKLTVADRKKHEWIKQQHPELDIRFVFQNPNNKLYKGSKTSYADWAQKVGITWCKGPKIPKQWTN